MNEQLLAALSQYGPPALCGISAIAAVGLPLPMTLLLIVAGSLVSQGVMNFWWAIALASAGSIAGDVAGYVLGRWGGSAVLLRLTRLLSRRSGLDRAQKQAEKWGGAGVFLSRWLVTPLGPWINLASGTIRYPWPRFLLWDALGETLGAVLFISVGRLFSDRVLALAALLGDTAWALVALAAAVFLAWQLLMWARR
jgi:membrane protein DedA with SNARE-associated domain